MKCYSTSDLLSESFLLPDLVPNSLLRFFGRSVSFRLWLFQIPPAMKNTSGSSKYLWLREIPLACLNTSGFEKFSKCLQLQTTPAFTNISSFERCLQLFSNTSGFEKNTSSSWLLRIHFFLVWELLKRSCPFRFFL